MAKDAKDSLIALLCGIIVLIGIPVGLGLIGVLLRWLYETLIYTPIASHFGKGVAITTVIAASPPALIVLFLLVHSYRNSKSTLASAPGAQIASHLDILKDLFAIIVAFLTPITAIVIWLWLFALVRSHDPNLEHSTTFLSLLFLFNPILMLVLALAAIAGIRYTFSKFRSPAQTGVITEGRGTTEPE